jgi:serine/threonine protein kinase
MKESNHLPHDMVSVGRRIGGYRLLRLLGKGGFGDVYLGEQGLDHSPVAIKILSARLTSPKEVKEFINEARMSRFQHPHIVPVLDFGIDRDDTLSWSWNMPLMEPCVSATNEGRDSLRALSLPM